MKVSIDPFGRNPKIDGFISHRQVDVVKHIEGIKSYGHPKFEKS